MYCYMATAPAPRDAAGEWLQPKGAVLNKRGLVEPPPVGDPAGFQKRMAKDGFEVRFYNEDRGDVIDAAGQTVHKTVVRRPGRALEIEE